MHGDWISAAATVLAAVIGLFGGYLLARWQREKREVRFVLDTPEDLSAALRSRGSSFELKVNGVSTQTLNASGVTVQNTGNIVINDLSFDIAIPGMHEVASAHAAGTNPKLVSSIKIDPHIDATQSEDKAFEVTLPYLNPDERFKITAFYDGELTPCNVNVRLPGVTIKTTTEEDVQRRSATVEELIALLIKLSGPLIIGVLLLISWIWSWFSH